MKICFFPHYSFSNRDGATLSMYNIIDELLRRGNEIVVVLPNKNHLEDRLKDERIDFIYMPMYSMRMSIDKLTAASRVKFEAKYLHNQKCVGKLVNILKDKAIDCIHINGLDSSVGAKVAKRLGIPYVWHIRAFIDDDLGKRLCHQAETYKLTKEANAVIGISKDIKNKFEVEFGRPVTVVYNGIPQEMYDIPNHKILGGPTVRLLLAGRISVQKGQMVSIKAIEILRSKGIGNVKLTLVGQGETKEYLQFVKDYINQHELTDCVQIMEHTDNLLEIRRQHDIGLTCSQREAFGRVTVENMMAGMLVIGANSGGTPEIISDGVDGLLYQVDNPYSLAEVIRKAIADVERSKALAQEGYKHSLEKYSIKRVVNEVVDIYHSVKMKNWHVETRGINR